MIQRRQLVQITGLVLAGVSRLAQAANLVAVRIWPAPEYTRITLESDQPLRYTQNPVQDPPRLAVDITGLELNQTLRDLVSKVPADDPNVARIRVGQYTPEIVRIVIDLKQPISPQVFSLAPVAAYKNRLVFDLYPNRKPVDTLEQLIAERSREDAVALAHNLAAAPDQAEAALRAYQDLRRLRTARVSAASAAR